MAKWKSKIVITDLHDDYENEKMSIVAVASELKKRLEVSPYANDAELQRVMILLNNVENVEEYDKALKALYNFGDYNHRIWVQCL